MTGGAPSAMRLSDLEQYQMLHRMSPSMVTGRQLLVIVSVFLLGIITVGAGVMWASAGTPEKMEVLGFSGNAGEWELTATLTRDGDTRELVGPMRLAHVGWCSQDGPQEKAGDMRVQFHRLSSRMDAKVTFDGAECTFSGSLSDAYIGKMACPGRRPVQLLLWIR